MKVTSLEPPRFFHWTLAKLATWIERCSLIDDLGQEYEEHIERAGEREARIWYRVQVVRAVPSVLLYSLYRSSVMVKNYATIALRNIRKQKIFSILNIVGLAVGLSLCLFVLRLVVSMYGSDAFQQKRDRIYRVISEITTGDRTADLATAPLPLAFELAQLPDVETTVRLKKDFGGPAVLDDKILQIQGYYADPEFFRVFSFDLEIGDPRTALAEPFSLVLTRELAEKLFGADNPIGRTLSVKGTGDFKVTGVTRPVSSLRSHMKFECLASFGTLSSLEKQRIISPVLDDWSGFYTTYVYLLLKEKADPSRVEEALPAVADRHYPETEESRVFSLQSLAGISPGRNLGNFLSTSAVDPRTPLLLALIAFVIMLIACFNYANLSLAKALARAKEVGIRKALGANRRRLVTQFIGEAVTYSLIALVFALFLMEYVVPRFFARLPFFSEGETGMGILSVPLAILLAVLIGILAGIVPALLFSKFDPAVVLKDISRARVFSKMNLRRGLLVFQFFVSFFFIITTIVIFKQIRLEERTETGFLAENILNVRLQNVDYDIFKREISSHPSVAGVSASSAILCTGSRGIMKARTPESPDLMEIDCLLVDEDFVGNMEIDLLAGRNFPENQDPLNESFTMINEKAAERLRLGTPQDAVGKRLVFSGDKSLEIIGVVRDFASQSLMGEIRPMVLRIMPKYFEYANIRITAGDPAPVLEFLSEKWKKLEPYQPFQYGFLEDQIKDYQSEGLNLLRGVSFIAFLAITIAFFGLLGMVIYDMDARVKEIGVRKILGASVLDVVAALSKSFVSLLLLAAALATPLAWFVNNLILQTMAKRIALGPGVFGLGLFILLTLGLATIFSQTYRAASGNPADSLRYE